MKKKPIGTYPESHSENDCDKCGKRVGKENLLPVPFLYLDKNDKKHKDLGRSYHQYYICAACRKRGA